MDDTTSAIDAAIRELDLRLQPLKRRREQIEQEIAEIADRRDRLESAKRVLQTPMARRQTRGRMLLAYEFIRSNPGTSARQLGEHMGGRRAPRDLVDLLVREGLVVRVRARDGGRGRGIDRLFTRTSPHLPEPPC